MKTRKYYILREQEGGKLPEYMYEVMYAEEASKVMNDDYFRYVERNGYSMTDSLAMYASEKLVNADGTAHRWSVEQVRDAFNRMGFVLPGGEHEDEKISSWGDATYLANMYYSDFYPFVVGDENLCIVMAHKTLNDKDGYVGMSFLRWVADSIGRGMVIDWNKYKE